MDILQVKSSQRNEWIDISREVQDVVRRRGVEQGCCLLFCPHTTAAVTINEGADPSVRSDVLGILDRLVPHDGPYRHAEGNSAAHAKSSLVGPSLVVPVEGGRLTLGTWQAIYFCEFDGPRNRKLQVHFFDTSSASAGRG